MRLHFRFLVLFLPITLAATLSSKAQVSELEELRGLYRSHSYTEALTYLSDRLTDSRIVTDTTEALLYVERAKLYLRLGDLTSSHTDAIQALKISDSLGIDSCVGRAAQVLVEINAITGDQRSARRYVALCTKRFNQSAEPKLKAEGLQIKGSFLRSINELDSAETTLTECLDIAKQHDALSILAKAHNNLGIIHAIREDLTLAQVHFKQCYHILKAVEFPDETISEALNNLAYYQLLRGNLDSARYFAQDQLNWSLKLAYPITEEKAYWVLSKVYESKQMQDSALFFLERHHSLKDSLFNAEITQRLRLTEYKSQLEVVQLENDLIKSKLQVASFRNWIWISLSVILIIISSILIGLYIKRTRENKILFERVQDLISSSNDTQNPAMKESPKLDPSIEKEILEQLRKWEESDGYLVKDCTLEYVAKHCGTNSKYLSLAITQVRGMRFPEYINHLRIQYILSQLQVEKKVRNYTVDALADLTGYRSTTSFTSAFKAYTQLTPSSYIKELKRNID